MLEREMETTFTYSKQDQTVHVFSAWPRDQRRIERAGVKPTAGDPESGLFYRIKLDQFRWRIVPDGYKRVVSPNNAYVRRSKARKGV